MAGGLLLYSSDGRPGCPPLGSRSVASNGAFQRQSDHLRDHVIEPRRTLSTVSQIRKAARCGQAADDHAQARQELFHGPGTGTKQHAGNVSAGRGKGSIVPKRSQTALSRALQLRRAPDLEARGQHPEGRRERGAARDGDDRDRRRSSRREVGDDNACPKPDFAGRRTEAPSAASSKPSSASSCRGATSDLCGQRPLPGRDASRHGWATVSSQRDPASARTRRT